MRRIFLGFSAVHEASESVTWRERVAEASCSAVRDGRDARESAVDRPSLLRGCIWRSSLHLFSICVLDRNESSTSRVSENGVSAGLPRRR